MTSAGQTAFARLQDFEQRGGQGVDPVRFRFLQAMVRRADNYDGEARRVLDARLKTLLDAFEHALMQHESKNITQLEVQPMHSDSDNALAALAALAALTASMSEQDAAQDGIRIAVGLASRAAYPELGMLDAAQEIWLRVSTDKQLRDSGQRVPDNAGPLNSSHLVHRAMLLMKELSPDYLRQFLSYANALAWMEQMPGANASAPETARASGGKKPARNRRR